jgi:hypothetical protein
MIQETEYGVTVNIEGKKFIKLRGCRSEQVMKDNKKYSRKLKHKGSQEWQKH